MKANLNPKPCSGLRAVGLDTENPKGRGLGLRVLYFRIITILIFDSTSAS